jgi:hypothetical protein
MGNRINQTIYELYLDIFKNHLIPVQDRLIIRMCEKKVFKLFRLRPMRFVNDYILLPTGRELWSIDASESWARYQRMIYANTGKLPICDHALCGKNVEFGYKKCPQHMTACCRCKRKEVYIGIDGKRYCYDCSRFV